MDTDKFISKYQEMINKINERTELSIHADKEEAIKILVGISIFEQEKQKQQKQCIRKRYLGKLNEWEG